MAKKEIKESPEPTTLRAGVVDYQDDRLGISEFDSDQMMPMPPTLEQRFEAGADLMDGCSGQKRIDTTFENTSQVVVGAPRSAEQSDTNRAPVGVDKYDYPHRYEN